MGTATESSGYVPSDYELRLQALQHADSMPGEKLRNAQQVYDWLKGGTPKPEGA